MNISRHPKMQAIEKAINFYDEIRNACSRPDKSIDGDTLEIYNELSDWGFTEKYLISDENNRWLYVVVISMLLHKEEKNADNLDPYTAKDKGEKWLIIKNALEKYKKS